MAGKTGTAQVRVYSQQEHQRGLQSNASLQWKLRDHALFIGFAPVQAPKYAIVCMIEHGATTPHPHVQMARDILTFAQKRDVIGRATAYPVTSASVPARTRGAANAPSGGKEPG
jgi:penicillin-binding protein 2